MLLWYRFVHEGRGAAMSAVADVRAALIGHLKDSAIFSLLLASYFDYRTLDIGVLLLDTR
jgi:hypothetical protein